MISCAICPKKFTASERSPFKGLFTHVKRAHGLSKQQYVMENFHQNFKFECCGWCDREAVPKIVIDGHKLSLSYDGRFLCKNDECRKQRDQHNIRSYFYVQKTYKLTKEQAMSRVASSNPFHKEYFDSDEEYTKFQGQVSLESFVRKHGEEEGQRRYNENCKTRSRIVSVDHYIDKFGIEQGPIEFAKVCARHAVTLGSMTRKYGLDEGTRRHESFLDNTLGNFVSQNSCECFDYLSDRCKVEIRHGKNSTEKKFYHNEIGHPVDGFIENENVVIEFYGTRWHMDPRFHSSDQLGIKGRSAQDVWNKDQSRLENILPFVNAIFICWEHDWRKTPELLAVSLGNYLNRLRNGELEKSVYNLNEVHNVK